MKKLLSTVLIFSLSMSTNVVYSSSTTSQTPKWQTAYKSYIQKYITSEEFYGDRELVLVDIDRDGVPELFAGESYRTVNYIDMAYTYKNGKVLPLTSKGEGVGESDGSLKFKLGMTAFQNGNILVYKEKKTGTVRVIGKDSAGGAASWSGGDYLLQLNGTVLKSTKINGFVGEQIDGEFVESYTYKGKPVSEEQYDTLRNNYYSQMTQITKQSSRILARDFGEDTTDAEYNAAISKLYKGLSSK